MSRNRNAHTPQFEPRIRFNWGYHDGAALARKGQSAPLNHYDKVYLAGVNAGIGDFRDNSYTEDSGNAWRRYQSPESKQARRMAKYR